MAAPVRATLAEWLTLPEKPGAELLDGELVWKASPDYDHGSAQSGVLTWTGRRFNRPPGGRWPGGWWIATEVDVQLGLHGVRPDVAGWRRDAHAEKPSGRPVKARPDWIAEILSPSHASNDVVRKLRIYHHFGVPHYWLVDPESKTLTVLRWKQSAYEVALTASEEETVNAEPFESEPLRMAVLFGEPDEE